MNVTEQGSDPTVRAGPNYIIIKGLTKEGKRFRPSDWADRLATAVGQFGPDRRVHFHPHVSIAMVNGEKCVIVDRLLEKEEPSLFGFLMRFAQDNNLQTESRITMDHEGERQVRFS